MYWSEVEQCVRFFFRKGMGPSLENSKTENTGNSTLLSCYKPLLRGVWASKWLDSLTFYGHALLSQWTRSGKRTQRQERWFTNEWKLAVVVTMVFLCFFVYVQERYYQYICLHTVWIYVILQKVLRPSLVTKLLDCQLSPRQGISSVVHCVYHSLLLGYKNSLLACASECP